MVIALTAASGFTEEYHITQVLLYYQDTTDYKLIISKDADSDLFCFDWEESEGYKNRETGFEFRGYIGAFDFENYGVGIYRLEDDCLAGFRLYPVVMRQLQVTSKGCQPLAQADTSFSGYWDITVTEGNRRETPTSMNLFYRGEGYWDGGEEGEEDAEELGGVESLSGGFGLAADDMLYIGFLTGTVVVLKMYEIEGDTMKGRWVEAYYDEETGKVIVESRGSEIAIRMNNP
jgi:hypothetical protein